MSDLDTPEKADERRTQRKKSYQGATILVDNKSTFSCVVKTRNENGFGLKLGSTTGVPDRFHLNDMKTGVTHLCRVVWRKRSALGVEIVS